MAKSPRNRSKPEWATKSSRVAWLAKEKFADSRSALARAIGFSHTIVAEVAKGRAPGPRLLDAIVTRLRVNREWLEDGTGQPFPDDVGEVLGIPVTNVILPGPPSAHRPMLTGWETVPEVVPSPTAYWLALKSSQPIVRQPSSGFLAGDHLLMETDPAKFPRETDLRDSLCVVRAGAAGADLKLAKVTHHSASVDDNGETRLEAEFPEPVQSDQGVVERVYRHESDGEIVYYERRLSRPEIWWLEPDLPVIRYSDIVSVWLKILRRPLG